MLKFEYRGNSNLDIIDEKLNIASFNTSDSLPFSERKVENSDFNSLRYIKNHYDVLYNDVLSIEFGFVKCSGQTFTEEEYRKVDKWLSDIRVPKKAVFTDDNGITFSVWGVVVSPEWRTAGKVIMGVNIKFQTNAPFAFKEYAVTDTVTTSKNIVLRCDNDYSSVNVYPVVNIDKTGSDGNVKIENLNSNRSMILNLKNNSSVVVDCMNNIVKEKSGKILSFPDIGVNDINTFEWLELLDGDNTIKVTGSCNIEFLYKVPYKYMGVLL